ncbi:cytochrome P450 4c3-like [Diorhabda sublineata]|nr:cytochrome P450 4c3-like [Diorhabda sublineata]
MLLSTFVFLLILTLIYKIWAYHNHWKYVMKIPGVRELPIIGNMLELPTDPVKLFKYDRWRAKHLYPIHRLWSFHDYYISILGPEDTELILANPVHNNKSQLYKFLQSWMGTGLITSNGSKWHKRRKILTPAFHFNILQQFVDIFNKETEELTKHLLELTVQDYVIDIIKPITNYTLSSMGETSLGVNLRDKNCDVYKDAVHQSGEVLANRIVKPILFPDIIFMMTSSYWKLRKMVKILHTFSTKIIEERKTLKTVDTDGNFSYSKRKRLALLDLMLEAKSAGEDIDDEGIREEVDTFMFAGHDTSAVALCHMLVILANEPKYQEEVYEEIISIVGDNQYPNLQQLGELKFTERCIKECLRLYPSVHFISRVAGETFKSHSGYTIPKGSVLNLYIYDLHRSPEVWEDPEKFDPDRFLPENISKRNPFAYVPFSAGSRNCIGQKFAMLELKAALCGILRKFRLVEVDKRENLVHKCDLVLRPVGEVRVKFVPRLKQQYLILLAIFSISFLIFYLWRRKRYEELWKYIEAIPGPKEYPIIGTNYSMHHTAETLFIRERNLTKEFFPLYRLWTLNEAVVTVFTPEDVESVLANTKHNKKGKLYTFLQAWLGTGLLTSGGDKWFKRRKILTPAFHFNILQEFVEMLNTETDVLVKNIEKLCDSPHIEITKLITDFTLNSIGETSLGLPLRQDPNCNQYKQSVYDYGEQLAYRIVRPWLWVPFIFQLSSLGKKNRATVKILHSFSTNVIRKREKNFNSEAISYSGRKKLALLDILLKARHDGADIDEEGIREELDTFIFEGHDTTSVSLCYTLVALANEQDIQEEIYQEILSVVGDSNAPSFQELGELKFMERCIKESLRLYPSVPLISRNAGENILTKSGYVIPKGCDVNIYIYDLHRIPEIWENPEKFDPDRFLPENVSKRHPFAYVPFSAGSRNCIGQRFAMLELKAAICGILRKFKLQPVTRPEEIIYKADMILRSSSELNVKFVRRK